MSQIPKRFVSDDIEVQRLIARIRAEKWRYIPPTRDISLRLRECPFCGKAPVLSRTAYEEGKEFRFPVSVRCNSCGISMTDSDPVNLEYRWNARFERDDSGPSIFKISLLKSDDRNNL